MNALDIRTDRLFDYVRPLAHDGDVVLFTGADTPTGMATTMTIAQAKRLAEALYSAAHTAEASAAYAEANTMGKARMVEMGLRPSGDVIVKLTGPNSVATPGA